MGDQEEKWPELSSMLGELGAKLDRLIDAGMEKALPDYADGIVLSATAQTVQLHEGYRYNYLVVSSDAATAMGTNNTLTIETPAIKYTQPIYEGINPLNIKGSSAKLSVSGLSGQYVAQFVETNESPLVKSAGVVKLAGSNVPLTASAPKLIATITAADITTASGITRIDFQDILNRNARQRTFTIIQGLNEALTSFQMLLFDSSIQGDSGVGKWWGDSGNEQTSGMSSGSMGMQSSMAQGDGVLAANVDSISFLIGMGATLPTTGTLDIYVTELI
ncbi:MAG: hypothetical protein JRN02_07255 [Nitrososphaerota archaeon]|nr:hypothetical protein [Nitrososphaerota archaeon]